MIFEHSLIDEIRNDNKDSFKKLYDQYSRVLYFFVLKKLHYKTEEAEELVQVVFVNLWEHRKFLDPAKSIKNYIFTSAVNIIYNQLRQKVVKSRFIESELSKSETFSNETYEMVIMHDLEDCISKIFKKLSDQQKKVFYLSRFAGLSHREISERLHISERTVENHIFKVLKIMKSNISGI